MSLQHQHEEPPSSMTRLLVTMLLNFGVTILELAGGLFSGSLSLVSDALHNFSDGVAMIISALAMRLSQRPNDHRYTFGLKRAEIVAAIINAGTLIAICFYLFKEAYRRLSTPEPVAAGVMIGIASVGLAANALGTLLLKRGAKDNMNIRAAYLHLLSDAVSSVAVIVGGIFIYFFKVYIVDPLLTIVIAVYVLRESYVIVKEAVEVIMMAAPGDQDLEMIRREIETVPGVRNIHHAHLWRLNDRDIHFEAHVEVSDDMAIGEATRIMNDIRGRLSKLFDINHATLQVECDHCSSKELIKA